MAALTYANPPMESAPWPPTDQLLPALFKACALIEAPRKTASNPHYKSKFATLEAVMDAVRKPLADNGLMLLQLLEPELGTGGQFLVTRLVHTSGQWLESRTRLLMARQDAQGMGSAITYMRRYTVQCMLGIVPEDDDGHAASHVPAAPKAVASKTVDTVANSAGAMSVVQRLSIKLDHAASIAEVDDLVKSARDLTYPQRHTFEGLVTSRKQALAAKKGSAK